MLQDAITNQWIWLGAAGLFIALLGIVLMSYRARRPAKVLVPDQSGEGWRPTGRIDFVGPSDSESDLKAEFLLQAEDARIVNSIGGLEHHEVRWRRGTLKEAKKVVAVYHEHLNLARTATPVIPASSSIPRESEHGNRDCDPTIDRPDGTIVQ